MALQQQTQHLPESSNADGFLHLEAIDVELDRTQEYSKLKIEIKFESPILYHLDVVANSLSIHWDCDIYVKSGSKAVLSIQEKGLFHLRHTVDKVDLDFSSRAFKPGQTIVQKGQKAAASIKLLIGFPKSGRDVASLLAPKALTALGTQVAMLDKLDRLSNICNLVLQLGMGASEVNSFAKAATAIVSTVFERFQDIATVHNEFVLIMEDVMELLPLMELAVERITDKRVQDIAQKFFVFVVELAKGLRNYASKTALKFLLRNWYKSRKAEAQQVKSELENKIRNLGIGIQINTLDIATEIRKHQLTKEEEEELERLLPPENSAYDPSRGCLPGTRRSVLRNVEEWAHSKDHCQRIYWIHGAAGCGKSFVAASVADALERQEVLSGSFFCKRDIPERRSAKRLIHSLIYFLARRVSTFRNSLLRRLHDDRTVLDKPLSYQFNTLLASSLAELPQEIGSGLLVVIVIDALDECVDGEIVASHLGDIVKAAPWLRLIVTSRPNLRIRENILRVERCVEECDLFGETTDEDVLCFAHNQFDTDPGLRIVGFAEIDVQALVQRAARHFIWISTILKHVSAQPLERRKLLQQIIETDPRGSSSEQNLDAIYLRVLEDASEGTDGQAVRLLVGLIFVISKNRPLPSKAIHAFFPFDVEQAELDAFVSHLASVLYREPKTDVIRACHPSFLDFVEREDRSGPCWTVAKDLEKQMTEKCFYIMLDAPGGLKFNQCNLETSHLPNSNVKTLSERVNSNIAEHLQYSCLYWFSHLSRSQEYGIREGQLELSQRLQSFLCSAQFLYWLEALSMMSEVGTAVITLEELTKFLKCFNADEELIATASDLYRFVTAFREPIATSAPHIYLSSLLWAPVKSKVTSLYCNNFNIRRCILKGVNEYWNSHTHVISAGSGVNAVALSPDGRHIVSGSDDETIRIWDVRTGAQVGIPLEGHQGSVMSVAYSPDGRHIVSGSNDETIRIWDVQTGAQVGTPLEGHQDSVLSVAYSPDGHHIVSGSSDKTIRIWDTQTGAQVGTPLEGHQDSVLSVAYSPDGRHIVSGSSDGMIRIWDVQTGTQVGAPLEVHQDWVNSVAYSPDGCHIVSGSLLKTIRIWDTQTGAQVGTPLEGHQDSVLSVAYSPDGRHIVSGSHDKTIRIWNVETGAQVGTPLEGHQDWVNSVAYLPDGCHIVSGSDDKTIRIWNVQTGVQVGMPLEGHQGSVQSVAYSPDRCHIVSGSNDKTIRIWDVQTGAEVGTPLEGHQDWVLSVAYSPDGCHIISGSDDETIHIWDVQMGAQVGTLPKGLQGSVNSVAYSPDGRHIVSGSSDGTIRIWDVQTGVHVGTPLKGYQHWVQSVAYSPDGCHIVSGSSDKMIRIWDAQTGAQVGTPLEGHQGLVMSVAYSPDGCHIVSGSSDKTIRIWDTQTGAQVGTPLKGHQDLVGSVAYSPDGHHIVSGSSDKTIRIWDTQTGAQVGTPLKGHQGSVLSVAYSPDGHHIISGSYDKTVRIWDAQVGAHIDAEDKDHNYLSSVPEDGWVRTSTDGLLLWIPHEYRKGVCDMSLDCFPRNAPDHPVKIDWQNLCHGETWTNVKINHEG